jgi:lipid-A-disaccharide synthase
VQEIQNMLALMVKLTREFPAYQFVIAGVKSVPEATYALKENIPVVFDQTHDLLRVADAALVTSGTATLETALLDTPQVVCYKTSTVTYTVGRLLVKLDFISLVNLIMGKEVVRELLQHDFTLKNMKSELQKILSEEGRANMLAEYKVLRDKLGNKGASDRAAAVIRDVLS